MSAVASLLSRSGVVSAFGVGQWQVGPKALANSIKFSTKAIFFSKI